MGLEEATNTVAEVEEVIENKDEETTEALEAAKKKQCGEIEEKDAKIAQLETELNTVKAEAEALKAEVEELRPFKAEAEKIKAEQEAAQLKKEQDGLRVHAQKNGLDVEDKVVAQMIEELNFKGIFAAINANVETTTAPVVAAFDDIKLGNSKYGNLLDRA